MITCIPPFGDGELKEDHGRKKGGGGQEKDGMERGGMGATKMGVRNHIS